MEPNSTELSIFDSQQLRHLKKRINQESGFEIQQSLDLTKMKRQAGQLTQLASKNSIQSRETENRYESEA